MTIALTQMYICKSTIFDIEEGNGANEHTSDTFAQLSCLVCLIWTHLHVRIMHQENIFSKIYVTNQSRNERFIPIAPNTCIYT